MPQLKLTYFDAPGRAEPIRIALRLARLPFVDERLKHPEFAERKQQGALPLGSVPVLEVDGVAITQTAAILRYVARLGDAELYPTDPFRALLVDSALDTMNDTLSHALTPSMFERDMEKKLAMRAEFVRGPLRLAYSYLESLVKTSGGPFVSGAHLSIADLLIAAQILQIENGKLDGVTLDHVSGYPRLLALKDAYLADPRIQEAR